MSSPRSLQGGVALLGATLLIPLLVSTPAEAQAERTRTRRTPGPLVISVTGKGTTKVPRGRGVMPYREPADQGLDWAVVKTEVKSSTSKDVTPSNQLVKLDSSHPFEAERGTLELDGGFRFAPEYGLIDFSGESISGFSVSFKPAAIGKLYAVDFLLTVHGAANLATPMNVTTYLPDGTSRKQELPVGSQHVAFVVTAATADWQRIAMELPVGPHMTRLKSVTVTTLQ